MLRYILSVCWIYVPNHDTWWRHQMETFSALPAICAGNSPVTSEFLAQRPVTRNFDVFFDLCLDKRLSKRSWGWWFKTPSRPLWRHRNDRTRDINAMRPLLFKYIDYHKKDFTKLINKLLITISCLLRRHAFAWFHPIQSPKVFYMLLI